MNFKPVCIQNAEYLTSFSLKIADIVGGVNEKSCRFMEMNYILVYYSIFVVN